MILFSGGGLTLSTRPTARRATWSCNSVEHLTPGETKRHTAQSAAGMTLPVLWQQQQQQCCLSGSAGGRGGASVGLGSWLMLPGTLCGVGVV
jgi:hypothetical protein